MHVPDSILGALDALIAGGEPTLLPTSGLEPQCLAVVGRINQVIARLQQEEVIGRVLLEDGALPTTISRLSDGRIIFANDHALELFQLDRAHLGIRTAESLWMKPELRSDFLAEVCKLGRVDGYEVEYKRADGSPFYGLLSATRITFRGEDAVLSSFLSIDERRRAEQALLETEKRARQLAHAVEQSPIGIVITDATGTIEYANPTTFQLTGYSPEELVGQNPRILKSGEQSPAFYQELWRTITAGQDWRGEFRNRRKNGDRYWESALISPLRDEAGKVTHFVAVKEDVTQKKKMEEDRETLLTSLKEALDNVKTLRGLLPICAGCKKIRNETGYWDQLESYFSLHGDINFTHGLCPDCAKEYFPKHIKG